MIFGRRSTKQRNHSEFFSVFFSSNNNKNQFELYGVHGSHNMRSSTNQDRAFKLKKNS